MKTRFALKNWLWTFAAASALLASFALAGRPNTHRTVVTPDTSLDALLGGGGREQLAAALAAREYAGKRFAWKEYAAWGKELVLHGRAAQPPIGDAPSRPLAPEYRCVHCHNLAREDVRLTVADPDSRAVLIRQSNPNDPSRRDGKTLGLTTGTTFHGIVNRTSFYNGYYARYRQLKVTGGRQMDSKSLADAVQVCCRYCSGGRFAEPWELDSLLAYLWDLELRLRDLDLSAAEQKQVIAAFNGGDAAAIARARGLLRQRFPHAAAADQDELPARSEGAVNVYADGTKVVGSARSGQFLYRSACAGCHGTPLHASAGAELLANDRTFHRLVLRGTERDGKYMPFFTSQRLSRQQVADIRAYLLSLQRQ